MEMVVGNEKIYREKPCNIYEESCSCASNQSGHPLTRMAVLRSVNPSRMPHFHRYAVVVVAAELFHGLGLDLAGQWDEGFDMVGDVDDDHAA